MPEPMDFAELAQQYRDEGAEEWVIWLAEHAEEIQEEMMRIAYRKHLASLIGIDGDNQAV